VRKWHDASSDHVREFWVTELTITTWNIHSLIGRDARFDLDRIAAVIRETSPDVVALQELGDFRGRIPRGSIERLADALGLPLAFGAAIERDGRRYGNGVLTKLPIAGSWKHDLRGFLEPRNVLRADIDLGSSRLVLFSVHLGLVPFERGGQVRSFARVLDDPTLRDVPVLLGGDFNHWPLWPDRPLERLGFEDIARRLGRRRPTFPSDGPFLRLDRFYSNSLVRPVEVRVHATPLARVASDHLPLVVRVALARR
jgi:endonuclease/exonuclease/phosphatase family metal-dependent hydrolase